MKYRLVNNDGCISINPVYDDDGEITIGDPILIGHSTEELYKEAVTMLFAFTDVPIEQFAAITFEDTQKAIDLLTNKLQ